MSDFNYQEYLKNNPLLQKEVKEEQLITEAEDKDVEEVMGIDRKGNKKPDVEMSKAAKAKQDAKGVKEEEVTEEEIYESALAQKLRDEAKHPDSKVGAAIFNKYAEKVEKANKEDYVKLLKDMESELISKHPDTFSGEDDIPGSFLSEETTEEIQEEVPSSKMKVSELKAKIKEDIISLLQEEEEEDVEAEIEDEVDVDIEEPAVDAVSGGDEGLSADEKEIQDSLKLAYDNAVAIGDTKLADQIGNSITFFTRTHVVER